MSKYRLNAEEAWDCLTILLQKNDFKEANYNSAMIHYAYVDYLRSKYGKRYEKDTDTNRIKFNKSMKSNFFEFDDDANADYRFSPDRNCDTILGFIRKYASRKLVAKESHYFVDGKKIKKKNKPISVRMILYKYYLGESMKSIADNCGLCEGRISQIINGEVKRLYNLIVWH
jgi:hypothetical protein